MFINHFNSILIYFIIFLISLITGFVRRVGRAFRRVNRRIARSVRRLSTYRRKIAKTDPKIYNSIQDATSNSMKGILNRNEWIKEKTLKKKVKNRVSIAIERDVQRSPMRKMRSLINHTIDESINHAYLKEVKRRGNSLKVYSASPFTKIFWRIIFPLIIAGGVGLYTYNYPDDLPPGTLAIPERQIPVTGGSPPPIDPTDIIQAILINIAVYGLGTFLLVAILIYLRSK